MPSPNTPDIGTIISSEHGTLVDLEMLLDDRGTTKLLRRTLFAIVGGVLLLVLWAAVANVDELARARGEIQPSEHVQVLQSQDGGTVVKLHVREGDMVVAGQPIADFSSTENKKLRDQADIRLNSLAIDRERMRAILENRIPDFSAFAAGYPMLVEQAIVSYREQIASRDAAVAAKRAESGQQSALMGGASQDKALIQKQIVEARGRLNRLEEGARKGVVTQIALSDARQQVSALEERLADASARETGARSTEMGAAAEVARVRAEFNQQLSQELSRVTEQIREIQIERKALDEKQGRIEIRAPVAGIVMNLPMTAIGAVVPPGGIVAEVVPVGQNIVMEVLVLPRDIGFVKEGQRANVKIDSFDSARFGSIEGTVKRIAPTSSRLKDGAAPYYKVEVTLSKTYVGSETHRLLPGMTGEADIATGSKSVLQYLLKPVFLATDTAFHER